VGGGKQVSSKNPVWREQSNTCRRGGKVGKGKVAGVERLRCVSRPQEKARVCGRVGLGALIWWFSSGEKTERKKDQERFCRKCAPRLMEIVRKGSNVGGEEANRPVKGFVVKVNPSPREKGTRIERRGPAGDKRKRKKESMGKGGKCKVLEDKNAKGLLLNMRGNVWGTAV